jgi:hypothetical protein
MGILESLRSILTVVVRSLATIITMALQAALSSVVAEATR